jgi:PKHD-type hydroxylase
MSNVAQSFQDNRYVYLSNVITSDQAKTMSDSMFELYKNGQTEKDDQCPLSDSVYNAPMLDELLHRLCAPLSKQLELELEPAYCYARIYRKGEVLEPHTDRPACEISGTMTLAHDAGSAIWPIFMGKDNTDNVGSQVKINVGDLLMYHGCELNHWRPEYKGEWQTQVFFHYVRKDGEYSEHAGDQARMNQTKPKNNVTSLNKGVTSLNKSTTALETNNKPAEEDTGITAPVQKSLSRWIYQIGHHDNIFPGIATVHDLDRGMGFTPAECQKIISAYESDYSSKATIGAQGGGQLNEEIRKVDEYNIDLNTENTWIFDRISKAVSLVNADYYKFELTGIVHGLSLLKYTGSDKSHYTWHTDTGDGPSSCRKISISIPLSAPQDYEGGDLIVNTNGVENIAHKTQGSLTMFPSFCMHTVTPVTAGERWVIVVWVNGPRFK